MKGDRTMPKEVRFTCHACKGEKVPVSDSPIGYGYDKAGHKVCFACCGVADKKSMGETGKITLYLTFGKLYGKLENWPGTLEFRIDCYSKGRHNWGLTRYDVWFYDHNGAPWHGVQIGDNTQLCHCKRMKYDFHTGRKYSGR